MSVLSSWIPPDTGEVYSTEETRIGTWIDGKPLYRKTKVATIGANSWFNAGPFIDNEDTVIGFEASLLHNGAYTKWFLIPFSDQVAVGISSAGNLMIYSTDSAYLNNKAIISVKYTKTTDQAEI